MDQAQYLLLMATCLVITLPLEFVFGARVYRSPRRLLIALVPTFVIFTVWDLFGIHRDHWDYSAQFISGIYFGSIPLEELVFFIVIPICGLLTYEGVGKVLALARGTGRIRYTWRDGLSREGTHVEDNGGAHQPGEHGRHRDDDPDANRRREPGAQISGENSERGRHA